MSDVLSQTEIDSLLAALVSEDETDWSENKEIRKAAQEFERWLRNRYKKQGKNDTAERKEYNWQVYHLYARAMQDIHDAQECMIRLGGLIGLREEGHNAGDKDS